MFEFFSNLICESCELPLEVARLSSLLLYVARSMSNLHQIHMTAMMHQTHRTDGTRLHQFLSRAKFCKGNHGIITCSTPDTHSGLLVEPLQGRLENVFYVQLRTVLHVGSKSLNSCWTSVPVLYSTSRFLNEHSKCLNWSRWCRACVVGSRRLGWESWSIVKPLSACHGQSFQMQTYLFLASSRCRAANTATYH